MNVFAPKRWTKLTWVAAVLWILLALPGNIPFSPSSELLQFIAGTESFRDSGATVVTLSTGWPLYWHLEHWSLDGERLAGNWQPGRLLMNVAAFCINVVALVCLLQIYAKRISTTALVGGTAIFAIILVLTQFLGANGFVIASNYLFMGTYFLPAILAFVLGMSTLLRARLIATEQVRI